MTRLVVNDIIAPDGRSSLIRLKEARMRAGETVTAFLERTDWQFGMPTICTINGQGVMRAEWATTKLGPKDQVIFYSRPGFGAAGSNARSIASIVGLIALAALAPWAGVQVAAVIGLGGTMIGGVAVSSIFSGVILAGGSMLLSHFLMPPAAAATPQKSIYSIASEGNQARPLGIIPVGYGRRLRFPEFGAPPYTEFNGDTQTLYELFVIGRGKYALEEIRIDDTPVWTASGGYNGNFTNVQIQICPPGTPVTLFNPNIVTATEVSGQTLPTPSGLNNDGWVGGYIVNASGTVATEIIIDLIWPQGAYVTRKERTDAADTGIQIQARPVDAAGVPTGAYFNLAATVFTQNQQGTPIRRTLRYPVAAGRYEVRARRTNQAWSERTYASGAKGVDEVQWSAVRAAIQGPNTFPNTTVLALRADAAANLSGMNSRRIATIQTRILEVWDGAAWTEHPSRSIVDAFIDVWRNTDYGGRMPVANTMLPELMARRTQLNNAGYYFDHFFEEETNLADALELIARTALGNAAFVGDRLGMVRDELRPTKMLFTDREIRRGSLQVIRSLVDEEFADGVVVDYFEEQTWRVAEVSSAPTGVTLTKPARVQVPGICVRKQALLVARHMAATNVYRRRKVIFETELEGRMVARGDRIAVQSEMPQSWGQVRAAYGWDAATRTITLDVPIQLPAGTSYLEIRRRNGGHYGPVRIASASGPALVLDAGDLAAVQAAQGSITPHVTRADAQDPASIVIGPASALSLKVLVLGARFNGPTATIEAVIDRPEVYAVDDTGVPPLPEMPAALVPDLPFVTTLDVNVFQRQVGLVLAAAWTTVRGATTYLAQISLDQGTSWIDVYRDVGSSFERQIPSANTIRFRIACVTGSGALGRWVYFAEDLVPPDLVVSRGFVMVEIDHEDMTPLVRRQIERLAPPTAPGAPSPPDVLDRLAQLSADQQVVLYETSEFGRATYDFAVTVEANANESIAQARTDLTAEFKKGDTDTLAEVSQTLTSYATKDFASSTAETMVQARLGDGLSGKTVEAWATQKLTGYTTKDEALGIAREQVQARLGDALTGKTVESWVTQTLTGYTTPTSALAISEDAVSARLGDALTDTTVQAWVTDKLTGYVTPESAQSTAEQEVQARLGNGLTGKTVQAWVTEKLTTYVTPETAVSIAEEEVQARLGEGITGTIEQYVQANATKAGDVTAIIDSHVLAQSGRSLANVGTTMQALVDKAGDMQGSAAMSVELLGDGRYYSAGMEIVAGLGQNNGFLSSILFRADRILFGYPGYADAGLSVVMTPTGARVGVDGNVVATGTIQAAHIVTPTLSALSANLGRATAGQMEFGALRIYSGGEYGGGGARLEVWDGT